jgi:hypothetical protein
VPGKNRSVLEPNLHRGRMTGSCLSIDLFWTPP